MRFIKKATIVSILTLAATACGTAENIQIENGSIERDAQSIAWDNQQDNPENLDPSITMKKKFSELPLLGEATQKPWPGYYWSTYEDNINNKWNGPDTDAPSTKFAQAFNRPGLEDRISTHYGIDSQSSNTACTEQSDCKSGESCSKREGQDSGYCIETWFGVCHAWAPAAVLEKEPLHPVIHNGVEFKVNDIKALISVSYDKGTEQTFISGRCDTLGDDMNFDEHGNPTNEDGECSDTNAGTFHVAVANVMGIAGKSFIEDRTYDYQVWNQPVHSYEVKKTKVMTAFEANQKLGVKCENESSSSSTSGGFNWGGACEGGSGDFQQPIAHRATKTVGDIPAGKADVRITLESDKDVDIQLVDKATGTELIAWPNGNINGAGEECTTYQGVEYCYSGYNGVGSELGHEWIEVRGETNRPLVMKAYGYAAGSAKVEYQWAAPANCVDKGCGDFQQPIAHQAVVNVGDIPAGKESVRIYLNSDKDVDVQLIDEVANVQIIAWPNGTLSGAGEECTTYEGVEYCYSGYNGDGTGLGNEWIEVRGTTNRPLKMKAFGYAAGDALVEYAWGEQEYKFNANAESFVYLETDLRYISEPAASVDGALVTSSSYSNWIKTDNYKYILELDAQGNIIGGEWVGTSKKLHPDFLWMPTVKEDTAVAADSWDGSDGIKWSEVKMLLEKSRE